MKTWRRSVCFRAISPFATAFVALVASALAQQPPQAAIPADHIHQTGDAGDQPTDPANAYTTKTTVAESYRTDTSSTPPTKKDGAKGEGTANTSTKAGTTEVESSVTGNVKPPTARSRKTTLEGNSEETTKEGVTTKVSTSNSQTIITETLAQPARSKNQPKSDQATADLKKAKPPIPLLVGLYDHSYQLISANPRAELRFFAARFALPHVAEGSNTGEDIEGAAAHTFFNRKAQEASRAVEWNDLCLTTRGVLNSEQVDLFKEALVLGVRCPSCTEIHWLAFCYNGKIKQFQIFSNSRSDATVHAAVRGWAPLAIQPLGPVVLPDADSLWTAPLDEGGWCVEAFRAGAARGGANCAIRLQLGLSRDNAGVTFAFLGPDASVSLIGDYTEKPISSTSAPVSTQPYDEQIQYYAVVAKAPPLPGPVLISEAANFGRDMVRGELKTLNYTARLKRERLMEGKVLILGVFNASRDENQWFSVSIDAIKQSRVSGHFVTPPLVNGDWYTITTGGFKTQIYIHASSEPENAGTIEYMFLAPQ
jgi:hypothetical protein